MKRLVISLVAILPSVAVVFLPFTYDVSPWEGVQDKQLLPLAAPYFLSLVIFAWALLLHRGRLGWVVFLLGYLLAAGGLACSTLVLAGADEYSLSELVLWAVLVLCTASVLFGWRQRLPHGELVLLALMAGWIPNAVLCCRGFWGEWQIGAYLTAPSIVLFVAWIVSRLVRHA